MARNWRPRMVPSCRPMTSAASLADSPAKNRSSIGLTLFGRQAPERGGHAVHLLAEHRQLVRPAIAAGSFGDEVQRRVLPTRPDVVDDDVPGQPEEPAPEGDAPRLVARQRLQGLDEDELRQVLRVARAADAGGDVAIDRPVVVVEQGSERLRITALAASTRRSIASSSIVITIRAPRC